MNSREHNEHLSPEEWESIFDLLERKPNTVKEDILELAVFKHYRRSNKTIYRALNVARELFRCGEEPLTDDEADRIVKESKYNTSRNFVLNANRIYQSWRNRKGNKPQASTDQALQRLYTDNLKAQINGLRQCLEHPGTELVADRGLLTFRGYGWRLDPIRWFCLSTPDIESKDWQPHLDQLKSHTPDWPFWKHWESLKNASLLLTANIRSIGYEIAKQDAAFAALWSVAMSDVIYYQDGSYFRPSRTTLSKKLAKDDYIQTMDDDVIEYLIGEIEERYTETMWEKQAELENMLEQLTIDFLDNRLDEWIVNGHCDGCP